MNDTATLDTGTGEGEDFEDLDLDDVEDIQDQNDVPKASFPFLMFSFGLLKDILDFVSGGSLSFIFSALFFVIFYLWLQDKPPFLRKNLKKFLSRRFYMPLIEFIPIIGALPLTALFVYMVYKQETLLSGKLGKIIGKRLEA